MLLVVLSTELVKGRLDPKTGYHGDGINYAAPLVSGIERNLVKPLKSVTRKSNPVPKFRRFREKLRRRQSQENRGPTSERELERIRDFWGRSSLSV